MLITFLNDIVTTALMTDRTGDSGLGDSPYRVKYQAQY